MLHRWLTALFLCFLLCGQPVAGVADGAIIPAAINPMDWQIIGDKNTRIAIKKPANSTTKRNGNQATVTFAYYNGWDDTSKQHYWQTLGRRIEHCDKADGGAWKLLWFKDFDRQGNAVEHAQAPTASISDYYYSVARPYESDLLHQVVCNSLRPRYLRAGMRLGEAKQVLLQHGFAVVKGDAHSAVNEPDALCPAHNPCFTCGQGYAGCFVGFYNKKTNQTLELKTDFFHELLIDADFR